MIGDVVEATLRRSVRVRSVDLVEDVARRCVREALPPPSRPAVQRRWPRALEARAASRAAAGSFRVAQALDMVQIDQTVSDLMVVDDLYRHSPSGGRT